ncbi:M28 family peptidase [Botryobacter ruber]|uniref:M28 family peptidase n=1 Tax=Botryobacter ruber TaxID=2171629 RepID=UPI000E0B117D|nr:M28 family peptidase [Botryobacter ruber]
MSFRNSLIAVFLLIALTGLSWLSSYVVRAPEALPADAPLHEFSAERAMEHVRHVARQPHPMGTAAHARVRNYLLRQLQQLDLQTEVQEATVANQAGGTANLGYVYNLMGRMEGRTRGKAVLLVAHYDSQANTPGAGDDGAGIAALLETARALRVGEPLQHDVIFLMTDGEEYGLYGAKAFLRHPWAKDVGVVVNVEARGNSGPSMTFEMSPENGWVIEQFAQAAPYPFASSLMYEVYRQMPNDTDFTVFKDAGYTGVNSAFIDGYVHYHKITDTPENLDKNSLQHHGSNMLALARHFGSIPLDNTKAQDKVFFNPAGSWLVQYPAWLNLLWVALTVLLLLVTYQVGLRRQALTLQQVLTGLLLAVVMVAAAAGLFYLLNNFVVSQLPYTRSSVYHPDNFVVAYLLLALGLVLLLSWLALRRVRLFSLVLGAYLLWSCLMLGLFFLMPAGVYLLLFPLLFCLAGTLLVFLLNQHRRDVSWLFALLLLGAGLPALFMLMPIVRLLFIVFSLQFPLPMVVLFVLLLFLFLPLLHIMERSFSWRLVPLLPLFLLLAGGIQVARAIAAETPGPETPLQSYVSYYLNTDTGQAFWASARPRTDAWNKQFFPNPETGRLSEVYPIAARMYLKNNATPVALETPVATLQKDSIAAGDRFLEIKLHSPRQAAHLEVVLQPQNENELKVKVNGEELLLQPLQETGAPNYFFRLNGLPQHKEVSLEVRLQQNNRLRLFLYDQSIGIPGQLVKKPMPAYVTPAWDGNLSVVGKSYTF